MEAVLDDGLRYKVAAAAKAHNLSEHLLAAFRSRHNHSFNVLSQCFRGNSGTYPKILEKSRVYQGDTSIVSRALCSVPWSTIRLCGEQRKPKIGAELMHHSGSP